jgi:hypothetical protein
MDQDPCAPGISRCESTKNFNLSIWACSALEAVQGAPVNARVYSGTFCPEDLVTQPLLSAWPTACPCSRPWSAPDSSRSSRRRNVGAARCVGILTPPFVSGLHLLPFAPFPAARRPTAARQKRVGDHPPSRVLCVLTTIVESATLKIHRGAGEKLNLSQFDKDGFARYNGDGKTLYRHERRCLNVGEKRRQLDKHKTNVPRNPLRWSLLRAATEFGIDRQTLGKRLQDAGQEVGGDGLFGSAQLASAFVGGDIHAERLRETRARALRLELHNSEKQNKTIPAELVYECVSRLLATLKQEILGSGLSEHEKRSLLTHMSEFRAPGQLR